MTLYDDMRKSLTLQLCQKMSATIPRIIKPWRSFGKEPLQSLLLAEPANHGHDYNLALSASIWNSKSLDISRLNDDMPSSRVKRLVLIYTTGSLEDHYNIICANAAIGLVRHRKNSTIAVSRSTRLGNLDLVHHISHPNIATIHAIFLDEKKSHVIYEHLVIDLASLFLTTEVELASALSQLLDGIQHLLANGVPFSADSVQVSLSGIVKIGTVGRFPT
ncbi:hypothetical protein Landi51_13932 [Colletotrichum acutatum]